MDSWNGNFGKNFTENGMLTNEVMQRKNIETGGAYQAEVSGAYGEFTIATIFKSLPDCYHVMNDILLQQGVKYRLYNPRYGQSQYKLVQRNGRVYEEVHKSTQIDHVIVSPYGIFVIETKNHKGYVFGDVNGRVWTQVLNKGKSHYTFYNPVHQNIGHMNELSKQLKMPVKNMTGMIVFTSPEAYLANVNCNCCFTVNTLYTAILSYDRQIWNNEQVEKVIHAIEKIDTNNYSNAKEHVKYVKDIKNRNEINKRR